MIFSTGLIIKQSRPMTTQDKLTYVAIAVAGAAILAACVFGAVQMSTHSSSYYGATVVDHVTGKGAWDPNVMNNLGFGTTVGLVFGHLTGLGMLGIGLYAFIRNHREQELQKQAGSIVSNGNSSDKL